MEALFTHRIMPPAIGDIRPEVLAYNGVPHKQKAAYRKEVCAILGWEWHKFFRETKKAEKMLGLTVVNKRKKRSDAGNTKHPELRDAARLIKSQHPEYGPTKIAKIIGHPAAYKDIIIRWLRAA